MDRQKMMQDQLERISAELAKLTQHVEFGTEAAEQRLDTHEGQIAELDSARRSVQSDLTDEKREREDADTDLRGRIEDVERR